MANISVRKIDAETMRLLRIRAASHGVSMEEEVRQIIAEAVTAPERMGDLALSLFGSDYGIDLQLPDRAPHEPPKLDE